MDLISPRADLELEDDASSEDAVSLSSVVDGVLGTLVRVDLAVGEGPSLLPLIWYVPLNRLDFDFGSDDILTISIQQRYALKGPTYARFESVKGYSEQTSLQLSRDRFHVSFVSTNRALHYIEFAGN